MAAGPLAGGRAGDRVGEGEHVPTGLALVAHGQPGLPGHQERAGAAAGGAGHAGRLAGRRVRVPRPDPLPHAAHLLPPLHHGAGQAHSRVGPVMFCFVVAAVSSLSSSHMSVDGGGGGGGGPGIFCFLWQGYLEIRSLYLLIQTIHSIFSPITLMEIKSLQG